MAHIEIELKVNDPLSRYSGVCFSIYTIRKELMQHYSTAHSKGVYEQNKKAHKNQSRNTKDQSTGQGQRAQHAESGGCAPEPCGMSHPASHEDAGQCAGPTVVHPTQPEPCTAGYSQAPPGARDKGQSKDVDAEVRKCIHRLARALKVRTHPDKVRLRPERAEWFNDVQNAVEDGELWVLVGFLYVIKTGIEDISSVCLDHVYRQVNSVVHLMNSLQRDSAFRQFADKEWWHNVKAA